MADLAPDITSGAVKSLYVFNLAPSYTTADAPSDSFTTGATVKASAFALSTDWRGSIEWWRPNNTKDSPDTNFTGDLTGNTASGTHVVVDCGTWTIKLYDKTTPTPFSSIRTRSTSRV